MAAQRVLEAPAELLQRCGRPTEAANRHVQGKVRQAPAQGAADRAAAALHGAYHRRGEERYLPHTC